MIHHIKRDYRVDKNISNCGPYLKLTTNRQTIYFYVLHKLEWSQTSS